VSHSKIPRPYLNETISNQQRSKVPQQLALCAVLIMTGKLNQLVISNAAGSRLAAVETK